MSRRRVSVKDLGVVDCEGWLLRRKEGRSFLGSRWKRYWFVLKRSSLYWYTDRRAVKADGFIKLSGFTIEPTEQCRKKHVITASHPLVVTIFMAAENFTDMKKWISKLSKAAEPHQPINTEDCYSEGSDPEGGECESTSCPPIPEQETTKSETGLCESSSCTSVPPTLDGGELLSRPDGPGGGTAPPLIHVEEAVVRGSGPDESPLEQSSSSSGSISDRASSPRTLLSQPETPPDEMECLYNRLKAARLSLIGRSTRRDFRESFMRRCQDKRVDKKLHLLRILSSTLKAKESELQAVDQILTHPGLTASTYRTWRLSNSFLLQEISQRNQAAGGAEEQSY